MSQWLHAFFLCICISLQPLSQPIAATQNIFVEVPVQQWLAAYLDWTDTHPAREHQNESGSRQLLSAAYMEVFSPNGISLYQGENDKQNAELLHNLQNGASSNLSPVVHSQRPTLAENIEMVPQLHAYKSELLNSHDYIVIAITNHDTNKCRLQDDAVRNFGTHAHIRVVEISIKF